MSTSVAQSGAGQPEPIIGVHGPLYDEYMDGYIIQFDKKGDGFCSIDPAAGFRKHGIQRCDPVAVTRRKALVVGLDIREYSKRKLEEQLLLTLQLQFGIWRTKELLWRSAILSRGMPDVAIQTGDGAYLVFGLPSTIPDGVRDSSRDGVARHYLPEFAFQAFSFIFALNVILTDDSARSAFRQKDTEMAAHADEMPAYPSEYRFAISYGDVFYINDFNKVRNCVGSAVIACARILSTDHGSHFLIQEELLRALEPHGGLAEIGHGIWEHRLHAAGMPDIGVKSGRFRYTDAVGFYTNAPLLKALGNSGARARNYHIGSHNVGSLSSGKGMAEQ